MCARYTSYILNRSAEVIVAALVKAYFFNFLILCVLVLALSQVKYGGLHVQ